MPVAGPGSQLIQRPAYKTAPLEPATRQPATVQQSLPGRDMHRDAFVNYSFETRHRCAVCGRYRSPSFHHRHPIYYGQPPILGVCRKCQQMRTSSDESTDDGRLSRKKRCREGKINRSKDDPTTKRKNCIRCRDQVTSDQPKTCPTSSKMNQFLSCSSEEYSCGHPKETCDDSRVPKRERHIHLHADRPPQVVDYDSRPIYYYPPSGAAAHGYTPNTLDQNARQSYPPQDP